MRFKVTCLRAHSEGMAELNRTLVAWHLILVCQVNCSLLCSHRPCLFTLIMGVSAGLSPWHPQSLSTMGSSLHTLRLTLPDWMTALCKIRSLWDLLSMLSASLYSLCRAISWSVIGTLNTLLPSFFFSNPFFLSQGIKRTTVSFILGKESTVYTSAPNMF